MNSWDNEETRKKRIEGIKQSWQNNPHRKKKASDRLKLKWEDSEYREKMSEMSRELQKSPEFRERQSAIAKEIWSDSDRLSKLSTAQKKRWEDPECRRIQSEKLKKAQAGEKYRKKMSHSVKVALSDKNIRKRMSEAAKQHWADPDFCKKQKGTRTKDKNGNWKDGRSFGKYCYKFNNSLKERCRIYFGRVCILCGSQENGRKLDVHHVYAEKKACCEEGMALEEMDVVRLRFPKGVAQFGNTEFSEEEIFYIRMIVPLCNTCHLEVGIRRTEQKYREELTDIVMNVFGGQYYLSYEEYLKYKLQQRRDRLS